MATLTRSNGTRSRLAILDRALDVAAIAGLHAATIGALSGSLGMSKSGVFAHFGSKEGLDLAAIDAAAERFARGVMAPAGTAPPGIARVVALCEGFLAFVMPTPGEPAHLAPEHPAFGLSSSPAARARLDAWRAAWRDALLASVAEAIAHGEMAAASDPAQAVFELRALLDAAARGMRDEPPAVIVTRTRLAIDRALVTWSAA